MTEIENDSFHLFAHCQKDWTDEQVDVLYEALDNYFFHKPSPLLAEHIATHPMEPLQVVRDRKIVDYMITEKGLEEMEAIKLWSDWEDYEYDQRELERMNREFLKAHPAPVIDLKGHGKKG